MVEKNKGKVGFLIAGIQKANTSALDFYPRNQKKYLIGIAVIGWNK